VDSFRDGEADDHFSEMASYIREKLTRNIDLPIGDAHSPISRYGRIHCQEGEQDNFHRLASDIMLEIQEDRLRRVVRAFFHSNGSARDDVDEILDHFWVFSAACRGYDVEEDDDESDASEDDENDLQDQLQALQEDQNQNQNQNQNQQQENQNQEVIVLDDSDDDDSDDDSYYE
jgi:hypothetical protein